MSGFADAWDENPPAEFHSGEKVIHKGVPGIVRCITHSYTIIELEDGRTVWLKGGTHE